MSELICTCDERKDTVCHDIRNEPHLVGCPRWGTRRHDDLRAFLVARWAEDDRNMPWDGPGFREASPYTLRRIAQRYADHPDYRAEWRP